MNPDHQPRDLVPDHVEWVPSSPDAIEVRVFGTWTGPTVPPAAVLVVGEERFPASAGAPGSDVPPAWSAAFLVPVEVRAAVEAGSASVDVGGLVVSLPAAAPGRMGPGEEEGSGGTLVDPAVLAERRARRAEIAEQSAADRAASAEQTADTLRVQLSHLEERVARAAAERDGLASRVADAERRLRLAEQREEAERRRRSELEEEAATSRRAAEDELLELRDRLSSAEEVTEELERQLAHARHRVATERAARERVDEQLRVALARIDELEGSAGSEAEELRRQAAALSDRLAEAEAERARLTEARATVEELETTRAEVTELRLRLAGVENALATEREARSAVESRLDEERRARELSARHVQEQSTARERTERLLEEERAARQRSERLLEEERSAPRAAAAAASQGDQELLDQVARLESELGRRAATQQRVQAAVEAVRSELAHVREQVDAGRGAAGAELRAEVVALTDRTRELEALVRSRDAELATARESLATAERAAAELRGRVEDQQHRSASDEQALRADFETRIRELTGEVTSMRRRLHATIADLESRLDEERRGRVAAETALAKLRAATGPQPAAAEPAAPAPEAAAPPAVEPSAPASRFAMPPSAAPPVPDVEGGPGETPGTGDDALDALISGLRAQVESARVQLEAWDPAEPEGEAPAPEAETPPADAARERDVPAPDEQTRLRLQAIEADLRAAVPDPEASVPAREVIASLQQAADRLRAAAEDELSRIDEDEAAGAAAPPVGDPSAAEDADVAYGAEPAALPDATGDEAAALGPRAVDFGAKESPWLRTALQRLAISDPERAAELFLALLPAQATIGGAFTYLVSAPTLGAVRVGVTPGAVQVETAPDAPTADVTLAGSLATLAPLAAGGAGWWLKGVRVEGTRRHARRLTRARRRPLGLGDLALLSAPPTAGTALRALAAAVEPSWTAGHRFGVSYVVEGEGRWTVIADDGGPLRVADNGGEHPHAAIVRLPSEAVLPLLQGAPLPPAQRPSLTGDRRAVDVLHAWFDRARGVTGR